METLRTADECFSALPDYPYAPHYVDIDGLRMAYVDESGGDAGTVVMVHGVPTWGYFFRKMIPPLLAAGYRVVVPDLIGFGRSDKPMHRLDHTYAQHVSWLAAFLAHVKGDGPPVTLVCHDWGGLLGLRVAAQRPELFGALVLTNTVLPEGEPMREGYLYWHRLSQEVNPYDCGEVLNYGCRRDLTAEEKNAYRAPFPDETYQAGARELPMLVPIDETIEGAAENQAAWRALEQWDRPVLTLWAHRDPLFGPDQATFVERIPGAAGQPHQRFHESSHYLPEDAGGEVAAAIAAWLRTL